MPHEGPPIPPPVVEKESKVTKDTELPSTEDIQPPPLVHEQTKDKEPIEESSFTNKAKPNLPYPSRLNKEKIREKDDFLLQKFRENFPTAHALIDVYEGEITLRMLINRFNPLNVVFTFNFIHNLIIEESRFSIDVTCEEYSQEVLGFSDSVAYNNPSPYFDPIVSNSSPTLTPFDESDFLLFEEADAFIAICMMNSFHQFSMLRYYDPGRILKLLNQKESSEEIPEVDLKELPPHLEYAS
ncbi:hypothetical protein Tco_0282674 [Tanacetum coccineum]